MCFREYAQTAQLIKFTIVTEQLILTSVAFMLF